MPDPFADLRIPLTPMAPRREFAADLRRRLEAEVHGTDPDPQGAPMPTTATTPVVATDLVPYLIVDGADAAIRFYVDGLGATEVFRHQDGDRIGHAEMSFGPVRFYLADAYPELGIVAPEPGRRTAAGLTLTVPDADAAFDRAVAHGATVERQVADQFYGERAGTFRDPFGHSWTVTHPLDQ